MTGAAGAVATFASAMCAYFVLGDVGLKAYSSAAISDGGESAPRFLRRRRRKKIPTPTSAATGMPIPKPTPRAVVLDFLFGSVAGEAVDVDPAVKAAVEALLDPDADKDALDVVAIEDDVGEAAEVWVCVYGSPMMVTMYTSAGDCAKVKISNPELAWQSQPS